MTVEFRVPTGYFHHDMGVWSRIELITTQPIDEEIFSTLEYVSEIDDVGKNFFKISKHLNPTRSLMSFRAFIRQSKTFYFAAKQLHYRASALLYYYAFLNLAKAYITVSDKNANLGRRQHGLSYKFLPGDFKNQGVYTQLGVFPILYEKITAHKIKLKQKLNIETLLGFCTDVAYEYELGGFGNRKLTAASIRIFSNSDTKVSWPVIAIANYHVISSFKKFNRPFDDYFVQFEIPKDFIKKDILTRAFGFFRKPCQIFHFSRVRTHIPGKLMALSLCCE